MITMWRDSRGGYTGVEGDSESASSQLRQPFLPPSQLTRGSLRSFSLVGGSAKDSYRQLDDEEGTQLVEHVRSIAARSVGQASPGSPDRPSSPQRTGDAFGARSSAWQSPASSPSNRIVPSPPSSDPDELAPEAVELREQVAAELAAERAAAERAAAELAAAERAAADQEAARRAAEEEQLVRTIAKLGSSWRWHATQTRPASPPSTPLSRRASLPPSERRYPSTTYCPDVEIWSSQLPGPPLSQARRGLQPWEERPNRRCRQQRRPRPTVAALLAVLGARARGCRRGGEQRSDYE